MKTPLDNVSSSKERLTPTRPRGDSFELSVQIKRGDIASLDLTCIQFPTLNRFLELTLPSDSPGVLVVKWPIKSLIES
jgi:hypothetical protein